MAKLLESIYVLVRAGPAAFYGIDPFLLGVFYSNERCFDTLQSINHTSKSNNWGEAFFAIDGSFPIMQNDSQQSMTSNNLFATSNKKYALIWCKTTSGRELFHLLMGFVIFHQKFTRVKLF